jgi:hypothetical protein
MKKYIYYAMNDVSKEPIDRVDAIDEYEAITYFARRKHLSMHSFLSIYTVELAYL